VIVAESGFSFAPGQVTNFAVVLSNPNATRWVALSRVSIDLLTKSGSSIGHYPASVTILPGGLAAVAGSIQDDKKTASTSIEIVPSTDGRAEWTEIDYEPGSFAFSKVKSKKGSQGRATATGRIASTFTNPMESLGFCAVYRNTAGDIIGGTFGVVDAGPAGGDASFKIESFIPFSKIATTEVYAAPSCRGPEFAK
jgi:hypothetical protein